MNHVCLVQIISNKSALNLLFALIPPTFAADKITILGLFFLENSQLLSGQKIRSFLSALKYY